MSDPTETDASPPLQTVPAREREDAISKRTILLWYSGIFAFYFALYLLVDCLTRNVLQEPTIFRKWTVPHAEHIYRSLRDGDLSLIRDHHFFPIWGTAIFLAFTDLGFLHNNSYLIYKLVLILLLCASNVLGASVLKDRLGRSGLHLGSVLGLNPIYFQILGGTYDQFFFCALFYGASMLLIKCETVASQKWRWRLSTAFVLGIAANVRSDMTYVFLAYLVLRLRAASRIVRYQLAVSALVFLVCLAPWVFLYHKRSGLFSLTSANTGGVAYLSLGQGSDRPWGGGDFTPWGVFQLDGWNAAEVIERVKAIRPDYKLASVFSDPWASKIYFGLFLEEISKRPYDYGRIALEKLRKIVFSIAPFRPDSYLRSRAAPPSPPRTGGVILGTMRLFHRITTLLLIYFGIHFVLCGMRYASFHIGGCFALGTIVLCSFFHYHDRHLFFLAAFQGMAFLSGIEILYQRFGVQYQRWGSMVLRKPKLPKPDLRALPKALSVRGLRPAIPWLVPLLLMLLLLFQDAVLGRYRKDLVLVDRVSLWEVKWQPKPARTKWNRAGNFIFPGQGITVDLGKHFHAKRVNVSLDSNDSYQINYRLLYAHNEKEVVAQQEIAKLPQPSSGLAVHDMEVPQKAVEAGYNEIFIKPLAGDGHYVLGHLRLHDGEK